MIYFCTEINTLADYIELPGSKTNTIPAMEYRHTI